MAKRKRLTPAETSALEPGVAGAPETKSISHPLGVQPVVTRRPPIAQVAGDAAAQAALEEVAGELRAAKTSGRMVLDLPLDAVDETYLVRDRLVADADELEVLITSLRLRGQQTPIEVVELGSKPGSGRYGLISGWRRLTALRRLDPAGRVQALLRQPRDAADAYQAMVEENEIRVGLSYYERARIVARAAEQGAYHNQALALKGLFGSVSRTKRSKIGSFLKLYTALDSRLRFPSAITERLGLALVKALEADPGLAARLRDRLRKLEPQSVAAEVAALERALGGKSSQKQSLSGILEPVGQPDPAKDASAGITLQRSTDRVVLSGAGITDEFVARLRVWMAGRGAG